MNETFKPHPIFKEYRIGNLGSVLSKKGKKLNPGLHRDNYYYVNIHHNKKRYTKLVHRLIAETYFGIPNNKVEVNHKNGNRLDNRLENLEWCTRDENISHAVRTGLFTVGEDRMDSKLTNDQAIEIFQNKNNLKILDLAKIYKVSITTISNIRNKKKWRTITKPFWN